jgi:hypothetical protein
LQAQAFNVDELQKAMEDPEAAVRLLLENPIIRRMLLEGLRKLLEPLVIASNLTWLVFRSAFDMITDVEQVEAALADPQAFFQYMLKKGGVVCKTLIALLQPKLEHLATEQSLRWVVVVSALEGIATVEMLLIAHEVSPTCHDNGSTCPYSQHFLGANQVLPERLPEIRRRKRGGWTSSQSLKRPRMRRKRKRQR